MAAFARLSLATLALVAALVPVTTAVAGKGGASPGVALGGSGIASADGALRYVARHRAGLTTVTAIDRDGQVVRRGSVPGVLGIPRVAFDGSLGGLASRRPRSLVARFARAGRGKVTLRHPRHPQPPREAHGHAPRQLVVRRALAGRPQALSRRAREQRQPDLPRPRLRPPTRAVSCARRSSTRGSVAAQ